MKVVPGNAQHIGDRESQQDAFAFSNFGDRAFERHGGVMMVLCDGMGGLANGAAASRAAVDAVLLGYSRKQPSEEIAAALDRTIREAHQAVCAVAGDAGTTVVVAVVWNDRLYWASLGDSRLYLCRGDAVATQLTEDHNVASLLERRVAAGESSEREAATATDREALTAYLGSPHLPRPNIGRDSMALLPGDRIIACSDGLYRGLSPEAIAAIAHRGDPMTVAEQMVAAVLEQRIPHQDNLTVALFEVSADRWLPEKPGPTALRMLIAGAIGFGAGVLFTCGLMLMLSGKFYAWERPIAGPPATAPTGQDVAGLKGAAASTPPAAPDANGDDGHPSAPAPPATPSASPEQGPPENAQPPPTDPPNETPAAPGRSGNGTSTNKKDPATTEHPAPSKPSSESKSVPPRNMSSTHRLQ